MKPEWMRKWKKEVHDKCDHNWQPVSMVFETQNLDQDGRVLIRQPDLLHGRCYCVCMKCCGHTYIETAWTEYFLDGAELRTQDNA